VIIGHFGVASLARSALREPIKPLHYFLLLGASVAPDVTDVLYWIAGVCSPYGLYSHTLHAVVLQAAVLGGVALLVSGSRGLALLVAVVVLLHMPGDLITGRKLFAPGAEMMGLGMYRWPVWDWAIEVPILVVGWLVLRRSGHGPKWATSVYALGCMVLLQTVFDVFGHLDGRGVKPNACPRVAPPAAVALVTPPGSRHVGAPATPPSI
jgi:hypothetical protein